MIFARGHWLVTPFTRVTFTDESTQPLINALLTTPEKRRYYLLRIDPYDTVSAGTVERNFGAGLSRISGSSALWRPRLIDAFNVTTDLFSGPLEIGGEGRPAYGAINIAIGDAYNADELTTYLYDGRDIRLYLGGSPDEGWTFGDYVEVFRGRCEEATWTEDLLTLVVRDPSTRLDVPIQNTFYAGTGGDEGQEELEGKPKPLCYGRPRNISPVLVDRNYLIYQIHDGPVLAIGDVYGKGDLYTLSGDTTDLRAWTPVSGEYQTDLSRGMFRLGSTPQGIVTADNIQGDSDLDLPSLATLDANNQELSLYLTDSTTISEVVDLILLPRGYRTFDTLGKFRAGRLELGVTSIIVKAPYIVSLLRDHTPLPAYRISLGYARNWTKMSENDLAAVGAELDKDFATNEWRRVVAKDDAVWNPTAQTGKHPRAKDLTIDSLWNDSADAQTEVDSLHSLVKADRNTYRVTCVGMHFRARVGETVRLIHPRFGLSAGKAMLILGVTENTSTGLTDFRLWG